MTRPDLIAEARRVLSGAHEVTRKHNSGLALPSAAQAKNTVEAIASALAAAEQRGREEAAAYLNRKADQMEAATKAPIGRTMAQIFRDEAAAIRRGEP